MNDWSDDFGPFDGFPKPIDPDTVKTEKGIELAILICGVCGTEITKYEKSSGFKGVDLCMECYLAYVDELAKKNSNKLNIYED